MAKLRITYRKSSIGYSKDQKATVRSLGLRKLNSVVVRDDTPSVRGMIFKVQHLVAVEEVGDDYQLPVKEKPVTTIVRAEETGASEQPKTRAAPAAETSAQPATVRAEAAVAEDAAAPDAEER